MPFLTLLDDRAKIKGSRDPLGFQSIWTRLGRRVVKNLTTVTTSVRGFTTLLLGLYFAEQALERRKVDETDLSDLFLKVEQLAAYSRVAHSGIREGELEILGIRRAKRYIAENKKRVRISAHPNAQILSNQKTYGLWGLYTVAARNSGLIEPAQPRLTPVARTFVETEYLPKLEPVEQSILSFVTEDQFFEPIKKHKALSLILAQILGPGLSPTEKNFYSKYLLFSGEENSLQQRLWEQIEALAVPTSFTMPELEEIIKRCRNIGDEALTLSLDHIHEVERVIAPAGLLFGYILTRDGQTAVDIAHCIRDKWQTGLNHLDTDAFARALAAMDDIPAETQNRLVSLTEALRSARYEEAIDLLLAQNSAVMQERGSSPWARFKSGQLDVRFRGEDGWLPDETDLPHLWVYTYFINSLNMIGWQLYEGNAQ